MEGAYISFPRTWLKAPAFKDFFAICIAFHHFVYEFWFLFAFSKRSELGRLPNVVAHLELSGDAPPGQLTAR